MKKIMIFEDDATLREMYEKKFSAAGYKVFALPEASEAVTEAKKKTPDIILMDIIMPKIDGFDATKNLMSDPQTSSIPVLVVSNLGDPATIQKALWFGAKDVLIKSNLTPAQLVRRTQDIIDGKPSEHILNPKLIEVLHIDHESRPNRKSPGN
ncbi:MAG: response regulator [Patescibacteria group bacterium]